MSQTLRTRSLLVMGASAAVLSALAVPAFAQQTAQQGGTVIEELVVTAQKREEALQDVPIAVSAFSQDSLEAQKIDGGPNLQLAIPNVSFAKGNFTNSFNFQIRGVGYKAVGASADQGVGVHMNNAPMQSGNLFEAEFYDVERVEVLRGPQGTLYGRNATGGVVNVITAKPTEIFEANARAEYGNYNAIRLRGMLNVPIFGEKLAVRLSGATLKRDGFVTNTFNGHTVDDRDLYSTRVQVMFNPTEKLRTNFLWERFHEDDSRARTGKQLCTKDDGPATVGGVPTGAARRYLTQGCLSASIYKPAAYGTVNTSGTLTGLLGNIFGFTGGDANQGDNTSTNLREIETALDPLYRSSSNVYQFTLNYDLSDTLTFTSMTAYSKGKVYTKQDYNRNVSPIAFNNTPFTPGGFFNDPQVGNTNKFTTIDVSSATAEQFSQELRLQSAFDGPINFNVGGIHFTYRTLTDYYVIGNSLTLSSLALNFSNTGNPNCNPATTARCIGIDTSADPTGDGHNYYLNRTPYTLVSDALFGEVYYQINEDLKFTLGLRQTRDKKAVKNYSTVLLAAGYGLTLNPTNPDQRARFTETTGRVGFDYKADLGFTDDTLLYAFYSKGYKGGGINPGVPANSVGIRQTFDPEFVNAFELGTKNTLMGGSLLFNATGFAYDYKGYQISKIVNRTSVNENVDAKIYGLELETIWSPVRNLKLNANVGYLHTKIGSGVTSIDTMNRTQSNPAYTVVKVGPNSSAVGANCVLATAGVATILGAGAGATLPWACSGAAAYQAFLSTPAAAGGAGLPAPTAAFLANATGLYTYGAGYSIEGVAADLSGNELPNSPHWTTSIGAQYTFELSDGWSATLRGDYYRQSKQFARAYNTEYDRLKAWDNGNLTLKVEKPEWGLSIDAYVKNIGNKLPIVDAYTTDDSSGLFTNVITGEPRLYGVAITKSW
ncbi:TonB-dependent receptor [Caulobacter segnis]|uniref:TonB-dependent receptor n=2 Tax=Caulobacter segnis TaxID=88688 RepID=D5VI51_CAUST|nr:TonB-dependent receptor [Caulobacter segnis]ADG09304.1 TonB-dependent receptor [Caulobacter segnis ATCC 21756]AVQ01110.1 TonB-dependent receptor [Caulobacter segnis]